MVPLKLMPTWISTTFQRPIPSADRFVDEVDSLSEYHIHGLTVANRFACSLYRHGLVSEDCIIFCLFCTRSDDAQ